MKNILQGALARFVPSFSESTLFIMGLSFLLLFILDPNLRSLFLNLTRIDSQSVMYVVVFGVLYFLGLFLAIIHVFKVAQKSEFEKFALITFAIITNVLAGFFAGSLALANTSGFLSVFPMLCVFNACLLIVLCMHGFIDESNISDQNANSILETIIGAFIAVSIIVFSTIFYRLHWSEIYSMCIVYGSNINTPFTRIVQAKLRAK